MTTKQIAKKFELTERQEEVLSLFNKKNQPSQAEAGKLLGCSSVNVCLMLKTLAEKGVIRRCGPGKRRSVEIIAK